MNDERYAKIQRSRAIAEKNGYKEDRYPWMKKKSSKVIPFEPLMHNEHEEIWIYFIEDLARHPAIKVYDLKQYSLLEEKKYNVDDYYSFNCTDYTSDHYLHWEKIQEAKLDLIKKISAFFLGKDISISEIDNLDTKIKVVVDYEIDKSYGSLNFSSKTKYYVFKEIEIKIAHKIVNSKDFILKKIPKESFLELIKNTGFKKTFESFEELNSVLE